MPGALVLLADMAKKRPLSESPATAGASARTASRTGFMAAPERMRELWPWVNAAAAFDYGDGKPLADLVRSEDIPVEFRAMVAAVVAGERKPLRGAARAKIPAAERMIAMASLSVALDLCDMLRLESFSPGREAVADREQKEVAEVVGDILTERQRAIADAASQLGVSVETVENALRDMKKRIARWPIV